jgi:flavorubredoxin
MATQQLFESAGHQNVLLEDVTSGQMVQTNQHLIVHEGRGLLLDPGGRTIHAEASREISDVIDPAALEYILLSHQDPDIVAAIAPWLQTTEAQVLLSSLWVRFIMHFGVESVQMDRFTPIADRGQFLDLAGCELMILPAHFLHAAGNFQVYDPIAKILYTGDLGASLGQTYTRVSNFDDHVQYMEGFHRRYMPSNKALHLWADMVEDLEIEIIAPQHGAMIEGREKVTRFLGWVRDLHCGLDLMASIYRLPT